MWVFTDGVLRKGTWKRPDKAQPAKYVDAAGNPILLRPGPHLGRAAPGGLGGRRDRGARAGHHRRSGHHPDAHDGQEEEVAAPCSGTPGNLTTMTERTDARTTGTARVKRGLAEMLRGGVIMDVVNAEQAKIAEDAGAVAVMALERVPADIRRDGGVARMSDPAMIEGIQAAVTIPVMAKCRIGHFAEAQVLESLGVDYIDESEVLTPADEAHHIDKWAFTVPFVCGATNLGEALRRISEGACMIRSKGEAGTGNIVEAVRHLRSILGDIRKLTVADAAELFGWAKELRAPVDLVQEVAERGELPVPHVLRRRHRHPGRRRARDAARRAGRVRRLAASSRAPSRPTRWPRPSSRPPRTSPTPTIVAKVSRGLGEAMRGEEIDTLDVKLADRGW